MPTRGLAEGPDERSTLVLLHGRCALKPFTPRRMSLDTGEVLHGAGVLLCMKPSTQQAAADYAMALPPAARSSLATASLIATAGQRRRSTRAVHAGPVTGLVAPVLLIAAIAGTVAVSGAGLESRRLGRRGSPAE